ncbi:MAG: hypothetical protein LUC44_04845 [Prevotellaceae bacterium]|nr:hypothetical protein [Prevotellaceae bacterium]
MRTKQLTSHCLPAVLIALVTGLSACVDKDYDLTKDIDYTITFGGDSLFLPGSTTEEATMDQILDIDEDDESSNVKFAKAGAYGMAEGDLYLYSDNEGEGNHVTLTTEGVTVTGTTVDFNNQTIPFSGSTSFEIPAYTGHYTMSNTDVSATIQEVDTAKVSSTINIKFSATGGQMTLNEGFTIALPDYVVVEKSGTGNFSTAGNKITVTGTINLPATLTVKATEIDFTTGIDKDEIKFSPGSKEDGSVGSMHLEGDVAIDGPVGLASGESATCELVTDMTIGDMKLQSVYGVMDPNVDENIDPMAFDDVPDVLQDEETSLDWENPQVYLTISNSTQMNIDLTQIKLTADFPNDESSLVIGKGLETTEGDLSVNPGPDKDTEICLSKIGAPIDVDKDVKIKDINTLLGRIPNQMEVSEITVIATGWVDLEHTYALDITYTMVAPLNFGDQLLIAYKDTLDGWRSDIDDIKRVNEVQATATVINKVPMGLTPSAIAIREDGTEIAGIKCVVTGEDGGDAVVESGTTDDPTNSDIKVIITAEDGDISELDGIILTLRGNNSEETAGIPINKQQSIQLIDVKLLLVGGVTVDLN